MLFSNYHTHTTYCDGQNTVEEMAQAALEKGFCALGFSGHTHMRYDESYCMSPAGQTAYVRDVLAARARYAGKLEIYLGAEDDLLGERPAFACDYTIGSVHALQVADAYPSVDHSREKVREAAALYFGGDIYALCRAYYACMARVQAVTHCDMVGHFDLVAKFNEGGCLFDEDDLRYLGPALEALEVLCAAQAVFEINTGAMRRGYRTAPYPSRTLLRAICDFGGAIVINSDSHDTHGLDFGFAQAAALARACGFESRRVLTGGRWHEIGIDA